MEKDAGGEKKRMRQDDGEEVKYVGGYAEVVKGDNKKPTAMEIHDAMSNCWHIKSIWPDPEAILQTIGPDTREQAIVLQTTLETTTNTAIRTPRRAGSLSSVQRLGQQSPRITDGAQRCADPGGDILQLHQGPMVTERARHVDSHSIGHPRGSSGSRIRGIAMAECRPGDCHTARSESGHSHGTVYAEIP